MITTIIYSSLSAAMLWLFYKLVLEVETIHRFKRVFLLMIFPASWLIPLIVLPAKITIADYTLLPPSSITVNNQTTELSKAVSSDSSIYSFLLFMYVSISLILLVRFLFNLFQIINSSRHGLIEFINGQKIVVLNNQFSPYSFGKTLFVSKTHFETGIEPDILAHERTHIQQGHSWDIVLAEMIIVTNWFNPFAWLLKKSIQLNHEFLADWAVLNKTGSIENYQYLLLNCSTSTGQSLLSSPFNHLPIKKRILMMFKQSPRWIIAAKQLLIIPMLIVLVSLFANRTIAQGKPFVSNNPYPAAKENAPQSILEQYKAILNKYDLETREGQMEFFDKITPEEKKKLVELFTQMSKEQQNQQLVGFMKKPKPLKAIHPTADQLENWKNGSIYGVWLNEKRIKNEELNKYSKNDFSYFNVSKLSKNAVNYGKHYYQVTLMTNAHYNEYIKDQKAQENEPLMYLRWVAAPKKK